MYRRLAEVAVHDAQPRSTLEEHALAVVVALEHVEVDLLRHDADARRFLHAIDGLLQRLGIVAQPVRVGRNTS